MEDQVYLGELNSELKKAYGEREEANRLVKRKNMAIARILNEINAQSSHPPVRISNDELAYTIAFFLKELTSTKKAFENCALMYQKDSVWSKKITTYRPFPNQLNCAFQQLEEENNDDLLLLKKYGVFNLRELKSSNTLSSVMTKLKISSKLAKKLHERDVHIKTLIEQLSEKKDEIKSLQHTLSKALSLSDKERVIEVKRLFPQKNYTQIEKLTKVSRQTVSIYLNEN
ncbi:hypothetical protein [Glaciecola sp. KUL10]|uniref:hypothetical protein n=1 Tax=Glaciecola sp. (strain KUL10) TaxID=2161813 RepID=UPI000D785771|nr:hypothetical protein [Glaciecola sp. KUL10]GBL05789.1 serine/threonine phosphatase [Glaciecola sp. KUL10]